LKRPAIILLLGLFLFHAGIYAQSLNFKNYTVSDGLVANPVRCIYQDSKGFLWIGTFDGLSRYDGYKFTSYTNINGLSHNFINSIIEVKGKLLIAENNGAIDVIKDNTIQKTLKIASAVNVLTSFNDRVILSTDAHGFYEYIKDTILPAAQEKIGMPLGHLLPLNDSVLLGDGIDNNLFIYKNDLSTRLHLRDPGVFYYSLVRDSKQRIWACTSSGLRLLQVSVGDKPAISFTPLPTEFNISPLNNSPVTSLVEEQDGSFWIGTQKGLVRLFPGGNFHVYNEREGLPSAAINALYRDRENNLWIGTALGLAKWVSKNNVVFYNTPYNAFKNDVFGAYVLDEKRILFNTEHGLQQFHLDTKEFKDLEGAGSDYPVPIAGSSPLLIHYGNKLGMVDPSKNRIVPYETLDTVMSGLSTTAQRTDGTIFLGTFGGLFAVKNKVTTKVLPHRITALTIDKEGYLWAGTWINGLFRIVPGDAHGIIYDVQDVTGLLDQKQIRALYTDTRKNIWIGTRYGGAFSLTPKPNDKFDIQHFNRKSGLMSDWISEFSETKTGDMWIGTYLGIDKLVKEPFGYRVFNFSKAIDFFAEVRKIVPAGEDAWICAANTGVVYFKDEQLHQMPPIQASILSASLGVEENKLTITLPREKIFLKPYQNAAKFEFSSPGYINEKEIMYTYRLKGSSDTSWSKPGNVHEASYESLPPGDYTFEVNTIGWNGRQGTPATFSFFISTPFWKQGWFIALCALLIAALIYSLYRYRIRQVMHLQQVRSTIATDLHDDIGSALTNISILAELSRNKDQKNVFAENLPGRIAEESTLAQQALDDIIWSVNSNNDNLNQTMARMRRYAAEVFEPVGINCKLDFENLPVDIRLNMEQRKDIYLVFKECLNNVIKHAAAKNAFLKIAVRKNIFHLRIKDDGKGFDPLKLTDRNGLKNIRSRVQRWNGKLDISSSDGGGTVVDCSFPLVSPK
jgi:ligand-binding sensor domain-containing protein